MNEIIKLNNISKEYMLGDEKITALNKVNLTVNRGDFLSITGASGSGKSTLMNILGFLDKADDGQYFFEGINQSGFSEEKLSKIRGQKIGFIFQSFNLIEGLSALENTELPLVYRKVKKPLRREIAMAALESVGLTDRALHKPSELSGGQQQRVAMARAIAADPEIILADEPCGNLDSRAGETVLSILDRLSRSGKTVVMITHNEDTAKKARRLVRISDGRIAD